MGDTQDTIQKRVFERGVQMEKIYSQIMESQHKYVARILQAEKRANVLEDALMSLLADGSAENKNRIKKLLANMNSFSITSIGLVSKKAEQEYLEE